MGGRRYTDSEKATCIEQYLAGATAEEIGASVGCCGSSVVRWLRDFGVIVDAAAKRRARCADAESRAKIVEMHRKGMSARAIASSIGKPYGVILLELHRSGADMSKNGNNAKRYRWSSEQRRDVVASYLDGTSMSYIAEQVGCSTTAVRSLLLDHEVAIRKRSASRGIVIVDRLGREMCVKSTWEAQTVVWLDLNEIRWDYELETFSLSDGRSYTPDFWLWEDGEDRPLVVDIKGHLWPDQAAAISLFSREYEDTRFEMWFQDDLAARGILNVDIGPHRVVGGITSRVPRYKIDEIARLYASGLTMAEVGSRVGLTESGVRHHLVRHRAPVREASESKALKSGHDESWRRRLHAMRATGLSMAKIGSDLGVNSGTVFYHLQRSAM